MNAASADEVKSVSARIEQQRKQLFKAMSIVEACRLGSDSLLAPRTEEPDFEGALSAAFDLLDDVSTKLEEISKEYP